MRIPSATLTLLAALLPVPTAARGAAPWLLPNFSDRVEFTVTNARATPLKQVLVLAVAPLRAKAPGFPGTFAIAMLPQRGGRFLPLQIDDLDGDGTPDELALQLDLPANTSAPVQIYYSSTLHDAVPFPQQVHASHAYGYNRATATIESDSIGYRTYGGFLFDVQAHRRGELGLLNGLLGYSRTGSPPQQGQDVVHYGQTLGMGGLFVQQGDTIFRPPFNTPTYTHKPAGADEPTYRIVATGPIRAIIAADLPVWHAGSTRLALHALYDMRAGEDLLHARILITQLNDAAEPLRVGAGVLTLPHGASRQTDTAVLVSGTQDVAVGELALGIAFPREEAHSIGVLHTPGGDNQAIQFSAAPAPGKPVELHYTMAAAWAAGGNGPPLQHLDHILSNAEDAFHVTDVHHATTPDPRALEGEPL